MSTPTIVQMEAICLECESHLFTTPLEIGERIAKILDLEPGDGRKVPPNTIRVWCLSDICATPDLSSPHRAVFVSIFSIPGMLLPK